MVEEFLRESEQTSPPWMKSSRCYVEIQLADGDAKSAHAQIAETQNSLKKKNTSQTTFDWTCPFFPYLLPSVTTTASTSSCSQL